MESAITGIPLQRHEEFSATAPVQLLFEQPDDPVPQEETSPLRMCVVVTYRPMHALPSPCFSTSSRSAPCSTCTTSTILWEISLASPRGWALTSKASCVAFSFTTLHLLVIGTVRSVSACVDEPTRILWTQRIPRVLASR